ncbi:MAG: hypothetical protein N2321_10870, partial [Melioribacteraceae bacterium]|nr:hypothetical protein [Melioribacteraceae bacterium]
MVIAIITFFSRNSDILSPTRIFIIVWSLVIGLTNLKLSYLQHTWQPIEWINILIGPISFIVGAAIVYSLNINEKIWTIDSLRINKNLFEIDNNKLFNAVTLLFILFIIGFILILVKAGTVPVFSSQPGKTRA